LHDQALAGLVMTVMADGKAGELHDPGRGQREPVRQAQQVAGQ
jgi:hypothetical protein